MKAAPTKKSSPKTAKDAAKECLYEALPHTLLRAPLLPVERYLSLSADERQDEFLSDPRVRAALAIGSISLLSAIDRFQSGLLSKRDADRLRAKLRRYLIRMSTRPTPYGLFAGVALVPFGPETNVKLENRVQTRTRPDMAWLIDLVLDAEARPEIRNQLSWFSNPAAFEAAGRLFLHELATNKQARTVPVSVRATGVVRRAMSLARTPIPYSELSAALQRATPNSTPEKVETLLSNLYEQTFLLTDLRPPLTAEDPSSYVQEKLAGIKGASEISERLTRLLNAVSNWDNLEGEEKVQKFWSVLQAADVPLDGSKQIPVQADMRWASGGMVGQIIAKEAAEAVELLLRLSAYPGGLSGLTAYRQAYVSRYGDKREVPLLELLDAQLGLGPLGSRGYANVGPSPTKAAERARLLTDLACSCLRKHQRVLDLDDELVRRLQTSELTAQTVPVSLDVNVQIGARTAADIDSGDFVLVIGPNLGAQAAGRNLGRFADLFGDNGRQFLHQLVAAEAQHRKEEIEAEIVYFPRNHRMANVVVRPKIRTHEVPVGVTPAVDSANSIALNELVVGVERDRFFVRWTRTGQRVRFRTGHMLSYHNSPAAIRFLSEVSSDGRMLFNAFDWGPAENFPFLPRVQKGRIVLQPAQWRIHKDAFATGSAQAFQAWLENWRKEWDVPRHICLSAGDNRLILDLEQMIEAEELRTEVERLNVGGSLVVQEVIPDLDQAWLEGAEGRYFSEMVVSVVLRSSEAVAVEKTAEKALSRNGFYAPYSRNRPPGSEWLFVKLYCPRHFENDIIADALLDFAEGAIDNKLADSWFFIRYSDPERHIRLRFHGVPEQLAANLFPRLSEWAACWLEQGVFSKVTFDTYEQELERFGGIEGIKVAEALFAADSRSAAKLLRCIKKNAWPHDETTFLALSIDDLLANLGLDAAHRSAWYGKQTDARRADIGDAYRKRKDHLRRAIADPVSFLSQFDFGGEIADVLTKRSRMMAPIGQSLRELEKRHAISQTLDDLCSSFIHLHVNRLASGDAPSESHIFGLLQRTLDSLRSAPVKK